MSGASPVDDVDAMMRPPPEPSSFIGSVVGLRYRVQKLIGRGGMGAVFLAEHVELGTPVALKVLISERGVAPEDIERFMREARAAVKIGHRNIVQVFDLGRMDDGTPYMAMECLDGADLDQVLMRQGQLDAERVFSILKPIASAIDAVHAEGLVHRDIKPANIFLSNENGEMVPKLLDFGLAQLRDRSAQERLTGTGMIVGTPHYLAPEVGTGGDPDELSDQYSLAVIAYEALCGQLPFDGTNPTSIMVAKVSNDPPRPPGTASSESLWLPLAQGLARDPQQRFESCTAFVDALMKGWEGDTEARSVATEADIPPVEAPALDLPLDEPPVELPRRGGSRAVWIGLALVLLSLGVGLVVWAPWRAEPTPVVEADPIEPPELEPRAEIAPVELEDVTEPNVIEATPEPTMEAEPTPVRSTRRTMRAAPAETEMEAETEAAMETAMVEPPPTMTAELERSPERAAELTSQGQRALLRGRLPQAARFFREATYNDPRHAPAWRGLGVSEERMGHAPEARRAYQRYLRLAPGAGDAAAIRARIASL